MSKTAAPRKTTTKAATKPVAKKATPAKKVAPPKLKPIDAPLGKAALVALIAERTEVTPRDVRAVLAGLEEAAQASLAKKACGQFTIPGLLRVNRVAVPAKPKRKGINPFTKEEQWFAAKPASVKLKARAVKRLKDAAE